MNKNNVLIDQYYRDLQIGVQWAFANRQWYLQTIIKELNLTATLFGNVCHNTLVYDKKISQYILRKGSVPAYDNEWTFIALNMRDGIFCGIPKNTNYNRNASMPHGAGRKFSRAQAIKKYDMNLFQIETKNIHSSTISSNTLDELPSAYKDSDYIINSVKDEFQTTVHLKTVWNFKCGA